MLPMITAIERSLTGLIDDMLAALAGIPDAVLSTWRPAAAREAGSESHAMNTFAALAIHTLGAAEYWTLMAAGAQPMTRVRDEEFVAQATLAELQGLFATFLTDLRVMLAGVTEADLAADTAPRLSRTGEHWPLANCLLHAVDHTALHLGHVQIQRQLWDHERTLSGAR